MPKFIWEGATRSGEMKKGVIEAPDIEAVEGRLRADNITSPKIKKAPKELKLPTIGGGVKTKDMLIFTRQLATMIDAGLPLVQCLDILASQTENPAFSKSLHGIKASVESGSTFSDALSKHPKVFDDLYVNLIAAGEVGGILDTILNRLGAYIEKSVKLARQVRGAMVYPISILCVAIIVIAVMLGKVIPVFEEMYEGFDGAALPKPTQVVIDISHAFRDNWYIFFGIGVAIVVGLKLLVSNPKGRVLFDTVLLKIPVIGNVLRKTIVARFTRTLGTLLSSGVPILDSLDICARTAGNKVVERSVMYARQKISEGKDMAGPLAETKIFPSMVCQMIGVGEQTGAMDQMLTKIADFYEDEVDVAVGAMTAMMEPLMMVFLGGLIGGLIVAMYLPVFELAGNVG